MIILDSDAGLVCDIKECSASLLDCYHMLIMRGRQCKVYINNYVHLLSLLLALYGSYTRQHLTLNSLKQCATAGRDVRHLVCQTELVNTSYRVATTDE